MSDSHCANLVKMGGALSVLCIGCGPADFGNANERNELRQGLSP